MTMPKDTRDLTQASTAWLAATFSMGFLLWVIGSDVAIIGQSRPDLARYGIFLGAGLVAGGIACLLLRLLSGSWGSAKSLGYVSCLVYFGCLKTLGWVIVPWVTILLVAALFTLPAVRKIDVPGRSVLLLHGMGTMSGLYMSVHLKEYLGGWEPFKDVLVGLWLFIVY